MGVGVRCTQGGIVGNVHGDVHGYVANILSYP